MTSRSLSFTRPPRPWWTLIPFLVAVTAVAGLGGLAASGSQATYRSLELPAYAPPAAAFGPVWSVLYLLIGVAGWLLWSTGGWDRVTWLWVVQLLLNLAWTPLFFAADLYRVALVEIVVLAAAVGLLVTWAWDRSRLASWLLVPYLAWVLYATALTAGIIVLN